GGRRAHRPRLRAAHPDARGPPGAAARPRAGALERPGAGRLRVRRPEGAGRGRGVVRFATVTELSAALAAGRVSAVELAEAALARIEAGRALGAFVHTSPERARVAAAESDARRAQGE